MSKIKGHFFRGVGKILDVLLTFLIVIVNIFVDLFSAVRQFFLLILSMGGCLIILILLNPLSWVAIGKSWIFPIIILALIVPALGSVSVSFLEYAHYTVTEFFYDRANHYLYGKENEFENISGYSHAYWQKKERERLKEEEERRKRREEEFNRRFRDFGGFTWTTFDNMEDFEEFFGSGNFGGYNAGDYQRYTGQNQGPGQPNMGMGFKQQYEKSCDALGVNYNADKYEVKLAYRKMAKKYHPDLNKEPGAKEKLQEINAAYEFLNDSNIERYKNMNKANWV